MKTRKRFFSLVLALVMCLGLLPTAALAEEESDFTVVDGVLTRYTGPGGAVVIPEGVTEIGDYAFSGNNQVEDVTFPESLRVIGDQAFSRSGLKTVVLPKDLEALGTYAFSGCKNLTEVTVGRVVETCQYVFGGCPNLTTVTLWEELEAIPDLSLCPIIYPDFDIYSLANVRRKMDGFSVRAYTGTASHAEIPEGIAFISNKAFADCTHLTSVTFPRSLHFIDGENIFSGCTALTELTIPDWITEVDREAFKGSSIQRLYLPAHLMDVPLELPQGCAKIGPEDDIISDWLIRDGALIGYLGSGGRVKIPDGVTEIPRGIFENNTAITELVIPDSVTVIDAYAFSGCIGLSQVAFPHSVTTIGAYAFSGCTGLSQVTFPDSELTVGGLAFENCTGLHEVQLPGKIRLDRKVFPESTAVTWLEPYFRIVDGVMKGYNGPGGDVVIPEGVTGLTWQGLGLMGNYPDRTSPLTGITFPTTMTAIGSGTLLNQDKLTDVTIPASVTKISKEAFLCNFSYESSGYPMRGLTVHGAAGSYAETWAKEMEYTFVADQDWKVSAQAKKHNFTIENGVLKDYSGPGGDLVVPDSVTKLEYGVFDDLGVLNSLTLPAGIQDVHITNPYVKHITVGDGAENVFLDCPALESATLPDGVKKLTIFSNVLKELVTPSGAMDPTLFNRGPRSDGLADIMDAIANETEEERKVRTAIEALKDEYPEGRNWDDDDFYYSEGMHYGTYACGGFAYLCSDAAFGNAPITARHSDFDKIRAGDILYLHNSNHVVVVLYKGSDSVIVTEGNYNGTVHWGRKFSRADLAKRDFMAASRWPNTSIAAGILPEETGSAMDSTQIVLVDGQPVTFNTYVLKDENNTGTHYVKLRDLAAILNGTAAQFQVGWDGSNVTITTKTPYTPNGSEGHTPFAGSQIYQKSTAVTKVNGKPVNLVSFVLTDPKAGGYTYYQLRDLAQALGFNVGWSVGQGIFVETDKPYDPTN